MMITRKEIAEKLIAYFDGRLSLAELVDWAEEALREADFAEENGSHVLRDVVARIGLADVKAFGLEWEDHKDMLSQLGYKASVTVQPQP
ncbi:MAG: hypothetical protein KIS88_00055 [Anaerolineales bacterium]|nr:hypothetical protein [Anaerolineales bacterium]